MEGSSGDTDDEPEVLESVEVSVVTLHVIAAHVTVITQGGKGLFGMLDLNKNEPVTRDNSSNLAMICESTV